MVQFLNSQTDSGHVVNSKKPRRISVLLLNACIVNGVSCRVVYISMPSTFPSSISMLGASGADGRGHVLGLAWLGLSLTDHRVRH